MKLLEQAWYKKSLWVHLLRPVSLVFFLLASHRRASYANGKKPVYHAGVPVIVVGNISVGGTGKTPLVLFLAEAFSNKGYRVGIVSRGYGGKGGQYPLHVSSTTPVSESGDETALLAQNTQCPIAVDPIRANAVKLLETQFNCNLIISDDGLQHYALHRDIEIAVVDGKRGLGNGLLLPAGPLREKASRLKEVDFVVSNGPITSGPLASSKIRTSAALMTLALTEIKSLVGKHSRSFADWTNASSSQPKVHAIAGIGNPERFFNSLCEAGFAIIAHPFKDHYQYCAADISFDDDLPVIMTEKDAVKCRSFASDKHWYIKAEAKLSDDFFSALLKKVEGLEKQ